MSVFTFSEAAEKLQTTERNIRRLVARGALKGTRLGGTGHLVVTSAAIEDYVSRGAPDYDEPPLSQKGGLYDSEEDNFLAGQIEGWIWEAARSQFLTRDAVHARRLRLKPSERLDAVKLTATDSIRHALSVPLPEPTKIQRKKHEALIRRFRSRREFYLAMKLRSKFAEMQRKDINKWPVQRLFESPDSYQQMTSELIEALKSSWIGKTVEYTATDAQVAELRERDKTQGFQPPSDAMLRPINVNYSIPISALVDGHDSRIIEVAF